jgi:hypothetical protein
MSHTLQCSHCQATFDSPKKTTKYCSQVCSGKAFAKRQREQGSWGNPKRYSHTCRECGSVFSSARMNGKDGTPRKFCSKRCSNLATARIPKQYSPETLEKKRRVGRENIERLRQRPDAQENLKAYLHSERNPFRQAEVQQLARTALREKGYSMLNGGNGTGMTVPQKLLSARLGWEAEYVVTTGMGLGSGYPNHYKIDLAEPQLKVAVEIDGKSHELPDRKAQDRKKEAWLQSRGWTVLRFRNQEVLETTDMVVEAILKAAKSSISRPAPATTSLAAS